MCDEVTWVVKTGAQAGSGAARHRFRSWRPECGPAGFDWRELEEWELPFFRICRGCERRARHLTQPVTFRMPITFMAGEAGEDERRALQEVAQLMREWGARLPDSSYVRDQLGRAGEDAASMLDDIGSWGEVA